MLHTRVDRLTLLVPQERDGTFSTKIFARYQRTENVLVLALMEMYVVGVSTRRVARVTEELCETSFSKSTVLHCAVDSTRGLLRGAHARLPTPPVPIFSWMLAARRCAGLNAS